MSTHCFESWDGPILRVAALDTPVPYSPPLEYAMLPTEEKISQCVVTTSQGSVAALEPKEVQKLVAQVKKALEGAAKKGQVPVLLTSPELRRHVRRRMGRFVPNVPVLSYNEIAPDTRLTAINR